MCSDIIPGEINYLGQSERVSRKIAVTRHKMSSSISSTFFCLLAAFHLSVKEGLDQSIQSVPLCPYLADR